MGEAQKLIRAFFQSTESGRMLLESEPNLIDARTGLGETPLHYLAVENQLEAVRTLVDLGSDVNTINDFGETPLSEAASLGYAELVNYLLSVGAKLYLEGQKESVLNGGVSSGSIKIVQALLDAGADVNRQNDLGDTALHIAAEKNHVEIINLLINFGADTRIRRIFDETPLESARNAGAAAAEKFLVDFENENT